MQDVDRPHDVQALTEPARACRPRVETEPLRGVPCPERFQGIGGNRWGQWDLRYDPPVRSPEPERSVRLSIEVVAVFMDCAMVPATEQGQVRERRWTSVRPVANVMPLADTHSAPREAAAAVAMVQRSPHRRGNRARPRPNVHHPALLVMLHHHAARVARQAARRFRGNVRPILEDGLAGLIRIGQGLRVDVNDHLVALARRAGIEAVVQRRLASRASASARCCATVGGSADGSLGRPAACSPRAR